jgi:hypothetical protein
MIAMGIVDPVKVVRTALQNAASVASLLITTEAMIAANTSALIGSSPLSSVPGAVRLRPTAWTLQPIRAACRPARSTSDHAATE